MFCASLVPRSPSHNGSRVRIVFTIGLPAVLVLSGAVACGGSSAEVANEDRLLTFSRSGGIYVIRLDGSRQRRLTRNRAIDIARVGSPDGRRIVFASDRAGKMDVEREARAEYVAGDLLGIVKKQVHGDLERFKQLIESRDAETGAWRGEVQEGETR
jgi:hypothetical protein